MGNTLLAYKRFAVRACQQAVTESCQVGYRCFNNRHLVVVDTPGFFANKDDEEEKTCRKIGEALQITVPGPHAFVIVLPLSGGARVTTDVEKGYRFISGLFGECAFNYCIIVFTGLDNLNADEITVEDFLKHSTASLNELMKKCGQKYVAFDNRASPDEKDKKTQLLLDLIDEKIKNNDNQVFQNEIIKGITKVVQEEAKKPGYRGYELDGRVILLPQTEKIVVEAYMRRPATR